MAYTSHGHHIPGTPLDEENRPGPTARCGGTRMCMTCKRECENHVEDSSPESLKTLWHENMVSPGETEYFDEDTMFKVFHALTRVGLSVRDARYAITRLNNEGILFRERKKL